MCLALFLLNSYYYCELFKIDYYKLIYKQMKYNFNYVLISQYIIQKYICFFFLYHNYFG